MKHKRIITKSQRRKSMLSLVCLLAVSMISTQLIFEKSSAWADPVPPIPTLSASVANGVITNAKSVSISYSGDAGNTLVCEGHATINGNSTVGILDPCPTSPISFGTDDGVFTFKVRQRDTNGNYSEYVQTSWTADNTAPNAPTLTSVLRSSSSSATAEFTFAGETYVGAGDQGFQCRLDIGLVVGSWESCQSPKNYSGLTQADHVFKVRQVDQAGNAGAQASKSWTVNLSAGPAPTLVSTPSSGTSTSATVSFTGTGPNFECKLNNQDYEANCISPKTYSGLADGNYTVLVRQRDSNGNVSNDAETTWTVDASSPTVARQRAPLTVTNSLSLSYGVEFNETVTGLTISDFTLASGTCTVSALEQSGNTFNISLTLCGDKETVKLRLNANSVSDAYGNVGPVAITEFPDVFTDTSRAESVFIAQKPSVETGTLTESKKVIKRNDSSNFYGKFPLATAAQVALVERLKQTNGSSLLTSAKSENPIDFETVLADAMVKENVQLFIPMAVLPVELNGEINYVVFKTRVKLMNPYLLTI